MRFYHVTLLSAALLAGCAERDTRTTRTTDPNVNTDPATTTTMETPRTPADRTNPGVAGVDTTPGVFERQEQTAARPVIEDPNAARDVDNTGVNKRDADTDLTKTPGDQGQDEASVDTTAAIRKQIVDMDLSTNADNVKIITENGKVTLRGVVESDSEKQSIEKIAREVAGEGNVTSELQVNQE